jgi:hypothetical protein
MHKRALDKRLEGIAWGLFLIMIGGLFLVPGNQVPEGTWLIGVGLILLGLNVARYLNGIEVSTLSLLLGVGALGVGISDYFGVDLPVWPILLIVVGVHMLIKALSWRTASTT